MKRSVCHKCLRPEKVCLCESIRKSQNKTLISILRHKSEVEHPFNTALIAKLSFQNVLLIDGELFQNSKEFINRLNKFKTVLLFPHHIDNYEKSEIDINSVEHIVVLDGSWNKAKKIFFNNKILSKIQRYEITGKNTVYNQIRATKKIDNSLSTIESICYSLEIIENKSFSRSLGSLHKMISFQNEFKN